MIAHALHCVIRKRRTMISFMQIIFKEGHFLISLSLHRYLLLYFFTVVLVRLGWLVAGMCGFGCTSKCAVVFAVDLLQQP